VLETEQGVVFARGGLVGETVRVSLDPKSGKVRRGRIISVLTPSASRVTPPCVYAERCGGCALMHASPEAQRALQVGFLRDALRKVGAPDELEVRLTHSERTLGYRRRARLSFFRSRAEDPRASTFRSRAEDPRASTRRVRGPAQLGFRRERSHELVDVEACLVLAPELAHALSALRKTVLPVLEGEGEISMALGREGGAVLVIRTPVAQPPALYAACDALVASTASGPDGTSTRPIAGVALYVAGITKPGLFGDAREWSEGHDGALLEGTVGGFSQAHAEINQALVSRVVELAQTEDQRVLELYAGAGNFTVALAKGAASYTAIEQSPDAVRALRSNLASRALTAKVVEGDVAQKLEGSAIDVVVLDPPRTGAPHVLSALLARKPRRIVYVSCDPATLARDVGEVLTRGYRLAWAEAFEMFPQTADLESVVLLERET
jgi:23S rRNA (uracil1939-C5)-methyltransferase